MGHQSDRSQVRLAELVAALSLGIDLGFGQPMEHVLRQCLIALRLAERVGLDEETRVAVYYAALLINVGCHSDAHEQAKWFGDDIAMKSHKYDPKLQIGSLRAAVAGLRAIGASHPPLHRFRVGLEFLISGHREVDGMIASHAALASGLAEQLGLPKAVADAVGAAYEQWDGRGWPGKLSGAEIPIASRIASLAEYAEVRMLRRASLVHAFGRLGVSNSIWDKPGALGVGEWERVRMQPYFTDRMLNQSAALAPLATIVAHCRERLDGSGYPRGISGSAISRAGRILAAADVYQALREPRPHRAAYGSGE